MALVHGAEGTPAVEFFLSQHNPCRICDSPDGLTGGFHHGRGAKADDLSDVLFVIKKEAFDCFIHIEGIVRATQKQDICRFYQRFGNRFCFYTP